MAESSQVFVPTPTKFLVTDPSDAGWGTTLPVRYFQGGWSKNEQPPHRNNKELLAVRNGTQLRNKVVSVPLDNLGPSLNV
jgi:hypothetical protein